MGLKECSVDFITHFNKAKLYAYIQTQTRISFKIKEFRDDLIHEHKMLKIRFNYLIWVGQCCEILPYSEKG